MKTAIALAVIALASSACVGKDGEPVLRSEEQQKAEFYAELGDEISVAETDPSTTDPPPASDPDDDQSAADTSNTSGAASGCDAGSEPNFFGECEPPTSDGAGDGTDCTGSSCNEAGVEQSEFCGTMTYVYDNQEAQWTVDQNDPSAVESVALEELRLLIEALANAPDSLVPAFEAWVDGSQQVVDALTATGFDPAAVPPEVFETVGTALAEPQAQVEEHVELTCGFQPPDVNEFRQEAFKQALRDWIKDFLDDEIDCIVEVIDPDALATGPSQEDLVAAIRQCVTPERLEAVEAFQQLGL